MAQSKSAEMSGMEEIDNLEEMRKKLKNILRSNGIQDPVSDVIIQDAGLRGEGFSSVTQYVTVKFDKETNKDPLHLFVKLVPDNPTQTMLLTAMKSFEKETTFLKDYLEAAKELCELKGCPEFLNFYPKCYYGDGKMIVLENLVVGNDYILRNKEDRQDLESAKCGVTTLAKHHALGYVMIEENGGAEKFFERFQYLDFEGYDNPFIEGMMGQMFDNCVKSNMKILERNDSVERAKETVEKLKTFLGQTLASSLGVIKLKGESCMLVLSHGDYWNNNMLFRIDPLTKKIVHTVAIDFQMVRHNSPSLDLGYYFYTSVQPHVREAHLKELLTLYKDTLNKVTKDFGHPTNLTFDQIFGDFKKKLDYGFWLGFVMNMGPGMALMKDVDMSKVEMTQLPALMDELINKWIEENPEKGKSTAEHLVKLFEEYDRLKR